jgi:hypothetical protein
MPTPTKVNTVGNDKIYVVYSDGMEGEYSLKKLMKKEEFDCLNEEQLFDTVYIDEQSKDIAWSNGVSICSNALYKCIQLKKIIKIFDPECE